MQTFYYTRGTGNPSALASKGLYLYVDAKNQSWVYQCAGESPPTDDGQFCFLNNIIKSDATGGGKVCRRQAVDAGAFLKGICETEEPPLGHQANSTN